VSLHPVLAFCNASIGTTQGGVISREQVAIALGITLPPRTLVPRGEVPLTP